MAALVERPRSDGSMAYQVRWRQYGTWQSETFGVKRLAQRFVLDLEDAGNEWPAGWTPGRRLTFVPILTGRAGRARAVALDPERGRAYLAVRPCTRSSASSVKASPELIPVLCRSSPD